MNLGKILICFIFACGCSVLCHGQSNTDSLIRDIRQVFQRVNSDSSLRRVELEADEFLKEQPDGGGELTGYFKGDTLFKMVVSIGLSYGMIEKDYYFDHGKVVFIYDTEKDYIRNEKTQTLDPSKIRLLFEGRYYFDKGKVIEKKLKGQRLFETDISGKYINDLLADIAPYTKLLLATLKQKR
jgi:hypothetical protein